MAVIQGWDALRRDNPWPEFNWELITPFNLTLDGGGRHLVTEKIRQNPTGVFLEIGTFLGGSAIQWLTTSNQLKVIGVDPWGGNWGPYIEQMINHPSFEKHLPPDHSIQEIVGALKEWGNFCIALNNLRRFKDRFIPIRQKSPEVFEYLISRGITPDFIYIDANKEAQDLVAAYDAFPNAILCGDDWNWRNPQGQLQMRENVERFAESKGFSIEADKATWLLMA